ncbi:hypothetical protein KEM55_002401, partial [Ascosphaera atra]
MDPFKDDDLRSYERYTTKLYENPDDFNDDHLGNSETPSTKKSSNPRTLLTSASP